MLGKIAGQVDVNIGKLDMIVAEMEALGVTQSMASARKLELFPSVRFFDDEA